MEDRALQLAMIGLFGLAAQWLAWWLKLPSILLLLLIGIVAGPVTGIIVPHEIFGDLLFPAASLGVAIILFEGSLTLRLHEIRGHGSAVRNLVTVGALITWLIIGAACKLLFDLDYRLAAVFGALVVVTGPTVIVPLLRVVRPTASIANVLRWEGIIIDPVGALLAIVVFEFILTGQRSHSVLIFVETMVAGTGMGIGGAIAMAAVLRYHLMPDYLVKIGALVAVLAIFTVSNQLAHESGLVAVTVMGMILANIDELDLHEILDFKESLTLIAISMLFIVLAARIDIDQFLDLGPRAIVLLAVVLFVARPLSVFASTIGSSLSWREKVMISWISPRGIVAAAVSALFAIKLEEEGFEGAELLLPLTFAVIIGTVVFQSATSRLVALRLGVAEPEARGVLIVGANVVGRAIGAILTEKKIPVLVTDTNWEALRAARMKGLKTYYGSPVSVHADRHLDLVGLGKLLAMSRRPALNALAALRYKAEFGASSVFTLRTPEEKNASGNRLLESRFRAPSLFGDNVTYTVLAKLLDEGGTIRATSITDSFDFRTYQSLHAERVIPLFALDPKKRLHVFATKRTVKPVTGWVVIGLFPAGVLEEAAADAAGKPDATDETPEA